MGVLDKWLLMGAGHLCTWKFDCNNCCNTLFFSLTQSGALDLSKVHLNAIHLVIYRCWQ